MKKKYVSTIIGVALATVGALNANTTADAATNVRPLHTTLSVSYNGKGNVRLLDRNGKYMNQYVADKASYKVFEVGEINGKTMYRIGSDKQWIPANYTNLKQVSTNSTNSAKANVVTIKYVPGYGIAVWTSPSASQSVIKGKVLKHNSSWKFFAEANGNDGYVWYNLGGNQWISSRYTNKAKVANSSVNTGSSTGTNTPAKPATPSKPSTDTKPVTPSKPNTGSDSKPVTPSKPDTGSDSKPVEPTEPAQPEFNKAEVERLLMEKISAYRMSDANPKNYSRNAFKSSAELQQLANTRLEEQKVAYGHVRPGTGKPMNVDDYIQALPNLAKQLGSFASAGENVTAMPEGGTPEEDADILFRSWLLDSGHKSVMMMDLNTYAYGAVSVMRDGSTLVAVFETVGR